MGENIGKVMQVMGPVVDVEFEQGKLPKILTSLLISNPAISDEPDNLVVEVAQHLDEFLMWSEGRWTVWDRSARKR